ncbi:hypothetical protein C0991_000468 [Blastosporella zonata]|nr:hypothetical protein C0991_000468 [Blastosporella zonata]
MFIFSSSDNSLLRLLLLTIALLAVTSSTRALPVKGVTSVELNARGAAQSRPQQCPSIKDIEAHIKAKSGGLVKNAVYWSYPGSIKRAEAFVARDRGDRHYIYDFVKNEDIARWGNLCPPEQGNLLWARASYAFAKLSKGSAYVVTGQGNCRT